MNDDARIEILIAEDSPTQAEQLRMLLEEHEFMVTVAANGKAALERIAQRQPALVISDVVMPELDGYGLCMAIKSDSRLKHIPVMLVTTLADPHDVIRGLECGADNFIRKPYAQKYLLSRIDHLLMNVELRRNQRMQMALEIQLGENRHVITAERQQILDLLISTYEQAVQINDEVKERERELAHSNQVLQGLNGIADGLNGATNEKQVAEMALQRALELPGIEAGWMFLRDGETGFHLAGGCKLPPALSEPDAFEGDCTCQQKLLSGELDSVTNIIRCERLAAAQGDTEGLCCHATVPLWLGPDQLLGVMNLAGAANGLFSEDELKVLYNVGNQVAVALERARLHQNLEALVTERTAMLTAEIQERKRVQQEQARLVAIIEATPDLIGLAAPDGRLLYTNQAGLRLMGVTLEEMRGLRIQDVHPEWARKRVFEEAIPEALDQGSWRGETAILGRDGREIPVGQVILAHKDPGGRIEYFSTIARDITQSRKHQARITRLNRIYAVLSSINAAIVRVRDEDELFREVCRIAVEHGRLTYVWTGRFDADDRRVTPVAEAGRNDGYLEQIDLITEEGIPGSCALTTQAVTSLSPAVCNDIASDERMGPWRAAALERGYRSVAVFPLLRAGQVCGVIALYSPEVDAFDDEERALLLETVNNVSYALGNLHVEEQRRQAETALKQLNGELEQRVKLRTTDLVEARQAADRANQAKSAFLATMSHEIRTPMNGILGMVDVLSHSKLSAHQQELVGTVRESASVLLGIIDDILDFSKIEAERLELEQAPVSIVDLVEGLCNSLVPVAARKAVELRLFVAPELPGYVLADDVRVRQVLYNLIGNAMKFSAGRPGVRGRVSVRAEVASAEPLRVRFSIADNGIGMDAATVENLFTPFTQAEVSTTRRYGGTGLGLAICKRLVDLMDGTIEVASTPGEGSTFTITLPLQPAPEQPENGLPDLSGLGCVVIDSPEFEADDLRRYLEHAGARVHIASDPDNAARRSSELDAPVVMIRAGERRRVGTLPENPDAVRQVVITRGRRRRARIIADDVVGLDGDALRRGALLRAVAVAAGRASPEVVHEDAQTPLPGEIRAPTVGEAREAGRLILVVEDDAINQKVILQQLALLGHAAELAGDGAEALKMWRSSHYALILTDLHMPKMDGYALAEAIRREERARGAPRVPILALTANALRGESQRSLSAGIDEHLTKPIQLAHLRETLDRWLPTRRSEAEEPVSPPMARDDVRPPVDPDVLRSLVGEDEAVVRELLGDYLAALDTQGEALRQGIAALELPEAGRIAHKLKSSSRAIGATGLGDLCAEIENACARGDGKAVADMLERFVETVTAVRASVRAIVAGSDSPQDFPRGS